MRKKKRIFRIVTAITFSFLLTFSYAPAFAASSSPVANINITNLKANASVSQKKLPKKSKIKGYRRVKLTWSSSSKAEQYLVYCSNSRSRSYKLMATVTSKSTSVLLPQRVRYIKVRAYKDMTYSPYSSWISVRAGQPDTNTNKITFSSSPTPITVGYKKTYKAKANGYVSHNVRWLSSNTNIATVNSHGVVKAKSAGTVYISAVAHNGITKSIKAVMLNKYPASITIKGSTNKTVPYNKTLKLSAKVAPAVYSGLTWTSSNKSVVSVSSTGKVTGKNLGTATITATALGGASSTTNVEVVPGVESYVRWAIGIANDNTFGYSMGPGYKSDITHKKYPGDRFCPFCHVGASKDYDCASFVIAALAHGLQDSTFEKNCAGSTYACGGLNNLLKSDKNFKYMGKLKVSKLVRGDILINPEHHVEIYIGNGQDVAAHDDYDGLSGDSTGKEIAVTNYVYQIYSKNYTRGYTKVYRYVGH